MVADWGEPANPAGPNPLDKEIAAKAFANDM
jgi:hypothetical protein